MKLRHKDQVISTPQELANYFTLHVYGLPRAEGHDPSSILNPHGGLEQLDIEAVLLRLAFRFYKSNGGDYTIVPK
jgi:hypothetical protein